MSLHLNQWDKTMKQSEAIKIHNEALELAKQATEAHLEKYGEQFYCGFAWVKITPATQSFARHLKKAGIVNRKAYGGGYDIHNPSGHFTQDMSAKESGAYAYARHLSEHGIQCYSQSRPD